MTIWLKSIWGKLSTAIVDNNEIDRRDSEVSIGPRIYCKIFS